jgi:hypothetical protein
LALSVLAPAASRYPVDEAPANNTPSCVVMINKWGGLVSSDLQVATLTQPLTKDVNEGIDDRC